MLTTLFLGAGFSRAVSEFMPLTMDLGPTVCPKDSWEYQQGYYEEIRTGDELERYLSSIAEPQPYLSDEENLERSARFITATRLICHFVASAQSNTEASPIPAWLNKLVRFLHNTCQRVITLNYDTLLETVTTSVLRNELGARWQRCVPHFRAQRIREMLPLYASQQQPSSPMVPTYELMKLHGSLDTYWAPGDMTGMTIERLPARGWGEHQPRPLWGAEGPYTIAGRHPFIVPPASAKSAYYSNPVTRQVWQDAAQALRQVQRVCLVGYSLPLTDLTVGGLLVNHLSARTSHQSLKSIQVVDVCPKPVKKRLISLGIDANLVEEVRIEPAADGLAAWVDELAEGMDLTICPPVTDDPFPA